LIGGIVEWNTAILELEIGRDREGEGGIINIEL
jgi:hypothetical protein